MPPEKKVYGFPPDYCQLCNVPLIDTAVDGRITRQGAWVWMCELCADLHGSGFGPGRGQLYEKEKDGWVKKLG